MLDDRNHTLLETDNPPEVNTNISTVLKASTICDGPETIVPDGGGSHDITNSLNQQGIAVNETCETNSNEIDDLLAGDGLMDTGSREVIIIVDCILVRFIIYSRLTSLRS